MLIANAPADAALIEGLQAPRWLSCCVCGTGTRGRQWWNRDTGFGLCEGCADDPRIIGASEAAQREAQSLYGTRGTHYALRG